MLRVRWLRSEFVSRMSESLRRRGAAGPRSAIFTIKKLNTKFTLSLDGLVGRTPIHGPAVETDTIIIATVIRSRRDAADVAGGGLGRQLGSSTVMLQCCNIIKNNFLKIIQRSVVCILKPQMFNPFRNIMLYSFRCICTRGGKSHSIPSPNRNHYFLPRL